MAITKTNNRMIDGSVVNVLDYGADSAGIQAAVDAAGVGGTILFPAGTYTVTDKININNRQIFLGEKNAEINCGTAGITMFERNDPPSGDGSNGSLCFRNLRFLGEGTRSSKAIFVSPNTPHVLIDNCYFRDFAEAVHLEGSYMSRIESCSFSNNYKGLHLEGACHATGVHSSIFHNPSIRNGATKSYGIAIQGDENGQDSGAISLRNIVIANTALQNSDYGCWAEKCENISFENIYHEGNYTCDIQLGVNDGGTNVRNVFGAVLDSVETTSPVQNRAANKGCINLEHVFRPRVRNILFAVGIPTSGTLLYLDGYTRFTEIQISEISSSYTGSQQDAIYMDGDSQYRTKVIENEIEMFTNSASGEFHGLGWRAEASSNTTGDFNIYYDQPSGRDVLNIAAASGSANFDIKNIAGTTGQLKNFIGTSLLTVTDSTAFRPGTDGVTDLGSSSKKWDVVYAATGTINTSDRNEKQQIEDLSQAELQVATAIKGLIKKFKFNDAVEKKGADARIHVGVIAQDVEQAFITAGLNPENYGLFCKDVWWSDAEGEVYEESGEGRTQHTKLGVRYEELLAFIISVL